MIDESKEMIPFMDTFYSLSSNDPKERSVSASSLLHHVFLSSSSTTSSNNNSNIINNNSNSSSSSNDEDMKVDHDDQSQQIFDALVKDGCYALTRLLNGLCSGRASARQGYASCFSSFLKLSFQIVPESLTGSNGNKCWMEYFMEQSTDNDNEQLSMTPGGYVRKVLLDHTSVTETTTDRKGNTKKAKKGSEERDHLFGKLFGILAVIRSGTLNVDGSESSFENIKGYMLDIIGLFELRKWLREPAAHAMKELLNFLSNDCKIISKLLQSSEIKSFFGQKSEMSAEKIALYLHLQTSFADDKTGTPIPEIIKRPILTVKALKSGNSEKDIQTILRDTSTVVYPRCHMVWESVWQYLCEKGKSGKGKNKSRATVKRLGLRKSCPIGNDSPKDVLEVIVNNVVVGSLLNHSDTKAITHERRALAMSLVSQLCQLQLPPDIIEKVILHPTIISNLFIQTLRKDSTVEHTLKPLALRILTGIVESLVIDEDNVEQRLAAIRSFLQTDPSFDARTKTQTVSTLLGVNAERQLNTEQEETSASDERIWTGYITFLQEEIFEKLTCEDGTSEAVKFIDLLCHFSKQIDHICNGNTRQHFFRQTSLMLVVGAFFNLSDFKPSQSREENVESIEFIATKIWKELKQKNAFIEIPHNIRVIMASRFFSLLSDYITTDKKAKVRSIKMNAIITEVAHVQTSIETLKSRGAKLINESNPIDDDSEFNGMLPFDYALKMSRSIRGVIAQEKDEVKSQALSAILGLVSSLSLHMLHPGQPDDIMNTEEEGEVDEVFDEILELVGDLSEIARDMFSQLEDHENDDEENPMVSLAAVSVNILNSSIGGSTINQCAHLLGGSRLIRDCIQIVWSAILANDVDSLLNEDVMSVILESICSPDAFSDPSAVDKDDDSDMNDDDSSDNSSDETTDAFTKANSSGVDVEDMELDDENHQNDEDSDVELDPSELEKMLLEDRDTIDSEEDEENTLEHHSGADGALAQLIKLKQESRKAGQNRREKIELSNRLRCFSLLEVIFASKRNELSDKIALMTILPLLRTRTVLFKSLTSMENSISNKKGNAAASKRDLMNKITSFLQTKIGKGQFQSEDTSLDSCIMLCKQIMRELKSVQDTDQCRLCSILLIAVVKAVGSKEESKASKALVEEIYLEAIREWSQKKNTKLQSIVFEDLIMKCPSISRLLLLKELVVSSKDSRSPFLKSESFRLLAMIYDLKDDQTDSVKMILNESVSSLSESLEKGLMDESLGKTKRVLDLLKAGDKLVDFCKTRSGEESYWEQLSKLLSPLKHVHDNSNSNAVKSLCKKIEKGIQERPKTISTDTEVASSSKTGKDKKSKTKKDKKKKKGKK